MNRMSVKTDGGADFGNGMWRWDPELVRSGDLVTYSERMGELSVPEAQSFPPSQIHQTPAM